MTCITAHQLIQEALDLPGASQPALDGHLAACHACRTYQESMQRIARELSASAQESAPSVLMERLGLAQSRRVNGRRWLPLGVVAAGLLIVSGLGPRLQSLTPNAAPTTSVVAELPDESLLDYFDPAEPAELDPLAL